MQNCSYQTKYKPLAGRTLILGVTGSIAAYKSAELVRELSQLGADVRVCLSHGAEKFIGAETFRGLTGTAPYSKTYAADVSLGGEPHVTLAEMAELMIVAPATAAVLSRIAYGPADEPVSLTALNIKSPLFIAPAMSAEMWQHPQVAETVKVLIERGVKFIGPNDGLLASGKSGLGRMSEPSEISSLVRSHFGELYGDFSGKRILVTAGGTREAVDPVRYLGNASSGKMGLALGLAARDRGAEVELITTNHSHFDSSIKCTYVDSASEMQAAVESSISNVDALIMAAAVADFAPADAANSKIKKSELTELKIELTKNPDIIKGVSSPGLIKVAFCLEDQELIQNASKKLASKNSHLIVANHLADGPLGTDCNKVTIVSTEGAKELEKMTKYDTAWEILSELKACF